MTIDDIFSELGDDPLGLHNFSVLETSNVNIEGRTMLAQTTPEQLTPAFIEAFYKQREHTVVRTYPNYSLAMLSPNLLTEGRLAVFKKYDMPGLAHHHYQSIAPAEFALSIAYRAKSLLSIFKDKPKTPEVGEYFLKVAIQIAHHHGFDTDNKIIKAATRKDDLSSFRDVYRIIVTSMGVERAVQNSKTAVQRKMLCDVFGTHAVIQSGKGSKAEKKSWVSNDLGL
jgi:hypothetical protein